MLMSTPPEAREMNVWKGLDQNVLEVLEEEEEAEEHMGNKPPVSAARSSPI